MTINKLKRHQTHKKCKLVQNPTFELLQKIIAHFWKMLIEKYQWTLATWLPIPTNNILVVSGYDRNLILTLFRISLFGASHRWREGNHISYNDELSTIIPYLKKIQKIYESCYTYLEFYWYQHFFSGYQQILLYQEM